MSTYLEKLEEKLRLEGFSPDYINLCMQYAQRLNNNKLPIIFDIKHLALEIGIEEKLLKSYAYNSSFFYKTQYIQKKSGGKRLLSIPSVELRICQRWILDNILYNVNVSESAFGFLKGKSIIGNASKHVGKDCLINLDLMDFFPSIKIDEVFKVFYYFGYTKEVSLFLAKLCTYEKALPQGAPTSPYLSNIVCLKLDKRLEEFCKYNSASYSRYADDITISGSNHLVNKINTIKAIISDEGFRINEKKTRVKFRHNRQTVTGLIVNEYVRVPRKLERYLSQQIYYSKKFSVYSHLKKTGNSRSNFKEHLYGIANFIKMVNPEKGESYIEKLNEIEWDY